jgi:MoaA/NifB/PqqE/SkfB family radical SAM enzyme
MAIGFSGSNGGITANNQQFCFNNLSATDYYRSRKAPMEVSYFINNTCNLKCRHCYVGYRYVDDALSVAEWKTVFDELIELGARTFGNVGKEPLLTWLETKQLLLYYTDKRRLLPDLRFGFVTNGVLLNESIISELEAIMPNYIDISLDGNKQTHNMIRGYGSYEALMNKLSLISQSTILDKVFISFTLNKLNGNSLNEVIETSYNLGIKNILLSPYITLNNRDGLFITNDEILQIARRLLDGKLIDFSQYQGLSIYFKNDFIASRDLMETMALSGIINTQALRLDEYHVIYNHYAYNGANVYFNYLPWNTSFVHEVRISHDGYAGNCVAMLYDNYRDKTIGNVRKNSITTLLKNACNRL